jgi:hypothetical protein
MTSILVLLVSVFASLVPRVMAWGPLHQAFRFGATQLKMKKSDEGLEEYRALLEQSFVQSYHDEIDIGYFYDTLSLRADVGASLSSGNYDWTVEAMTACGDDCEECLIPEDLKILPDCEKDIDVMAFLGIQRAEPLQVTRSGTIDWD